jgi:hypothetical protein
MEISYRKNPANRRIIVCEMDEKEALAIERDLIARKYANGQTVKEFRKLLSVLLRALGN